MCGICGIFNLESRYIADSDVLLKNMCAAIAHRGPDEDGIYLDDHNGVGLGHRRLSIIDLSGGKQPMSNLDGTIWIVFNGEIYNFPELKKELELKGYRFRTKSDTEVIISVYEEYGEEGFNRLNGIFAFALYDKRKKSLILARDHFGVKPLYYAFLNRSLVFGSEIKAIIEFPAYKKELDYAACNSFFTFRYNPSPQTLFKNIKKLYPGYYLKVQEGRSIEPEPYWKYMPVINKRISENEAIEEYQRLLEQAVKRQMLSDVPVGLFLSGGVDSAVIGYLMQKYSGGKIKSFSIGFPGIGNFNELADAKITAEFIGSEHYETELSEKAYLDFFFKSFYSTEEPIATTTISALYYVAKLARQHLKVVLAGQGADEPLAGYPRYVGEKYLSEFPLFFLVLPLQVLSGLLPRNEQLKRAIYANRFPLGVDRFLAIYTIFTPRQKDSLFNDEIKNHLSNCDKEMVERLYAQSTRLKGSLAKLMFIDTRMSLSDNLLLFNDKVTMANSLEMRVPFLDIDLVKFIESLPASLKLRGLQGKYIHKNAVLKWLPKEIAYRKKRSFETPMDKWLRSDLADTARQIINERNSSCRRYFSISYINKMIEQHQAGKENLHRHIFLLLSFEIWHRTFFNQ